MDKRAQKRWKREHGKRTIGEKAKDLLSKVLPKSNSRWKFHKEQWGDLEVLVLPKTDRGTMQVSDSNTGVVMSAPYHGTLKAHLVVNNGSKPNADPEAINQIMTGSRSKDLKIGQPPGYEIVHCLPRCRMPDEWRNEGYWQAVDAMKQGKGMSPEEATNLADQILGWSPDTISCSTCGLVIHGLGAKELMDQAREYNWSIRFPITQDSTKCPACSPFPHPGPIPSWEELCILIPGLDKE